MVDAHAASGTSYLLRRLFLLPVILGVVALSTFLISYSVPPRVRAVAALEKHISEARIQSIIRENGWDRPFIDQFLTYLHRALQGDLGRSVVNREPVASAIRRKFPATAELALVSLFIAIFIGMCLGIASATRRNSWVDYSSALLALGGLSIPVFWLALIAQGFISEYVNIPLLGRGDPGTVRTGFYLLDSLLAGDLAAFGDCFQRLMVPATVLATVPMAIVTRITRASMLDVLGADYIRTARSKGLPRAAILLRHALKNAALPILTIAGLQLGYLLGGAVLTETIFDWNGLGSYVAQALLANDFAPVQGGVLVMATTFVLVNLSVDLLYARLDPRVKLG